MKKDKIDIVIIDSGLSHAHADIDYSNFRGIHLFENNGVLEKDSDIDDAIGHGTAIYHILRKENPQAEILVVKAFENDVQVDVGTMYKVLEYINTNYCAKVINLSYGIEYGDSISELEQICKQIFNNGTYIVCAFANSGAISYPAAFECVIGVDICLSCKHVHEYEYVEESDINIRACGITQRVPWINGTYKRVSGTSFSCPHVSSVIYQIVKDKFISREELNLILKSKAKRVYEHTIRKDIKKPFKIKKAVAFPFNKEIHSLCIYSDLLQFSLEKIYDCKYLGNCGKQVSRCLVPKVSKDFEILNIDQVSWQDDFDTLILGHTRELRNMLGNDIRREIIANCVKYGKNIFSFEDLQDILSEYNSLPIKVYCPMAAQEHVPQNRFGKLYKVGIPIVCVVGTTSKQGKFTTQLYLRRMFCNDGYKVGQLATEPSGDLFGCDAVYPMGYDSTAYLDGMDEITIINSLLHNIEEKQVDIIIAGSQSQTIPYDYGNLKYMPIHQNNFLYAVNPDGYILVCNYFDDDDYIMRTVAYLKHFADENNIIGISVFPADEDLQWSYLSNFRKMICFEEARERADNIEILTGIKAFVAGYENNLLYQECIKYFNE